MKKKLLITILILIVFIFLFFFINNFTYKDDTISMEYNTFKSDDSNYQLFKIYTISLNDMEKINNIYYKKISTYEEYKHYKNKYKSILEMTQEDFNDNFMIITAIENSSMQHLIPKRIYKDNNTLYIGLYKNTEKNDDFNAISIILSKELDGEKIDIYKDIQDSISYTNYLDIKLLPKEYTSENAINDMCYVVKPKNEIYNQEVFSKFLDCIDKGESTFIRVVKFTSENETYITDIYYESKKGKFFVCEDWTRSEKNFTYNYYEYSKLEHRIVDGEANYSFYVLTDLDEEDIAIYTNSK